MSRTCTQRREQQQIKMTLQHLTAHASQFYASPGNRVNITPGRRQLVNAPTTDGCAMSPPLARLSGSSWNFETAIL